MLKSHSARSPRRPVDGAAGRQSPGGETGSSVTREGPHEAHHWRILVHTRWPGWASPQGGALLDAKGPDLGFHRTLVTGFLMFALLSWA